MTVVSTTMPPTTEVGARVKLGCPGLDTILGGGLPAGRLYLLEGDPGAGKTTLALQFVAEGLKQGERVLYITLSESSSELAFAAGTHGLPIEGIEIVELLRVRD